MSLATSAVLETCQTTPPHTWRLTSWQPSTSPESPAHTSGNWGNDHALQRVRTWEDRAVAVPMVSQFNEFLTFSYNLPCNGHAETVTSSWLSAPPFRPKSLGDSCQVTSSSPKRQCLVRDPQAWFATHFHVTILVTSIQWKHYSLSSQWLPGRVGRLEIPGTDDQTIIC